MLTYKCKIDKKVDYLVNDENAKATVAINELYISFLVYELFTKSFICWTYWEKIR